MALLDDQALVRLIETVYASGADGDWPAALRALLPAWRATAGSILVQTDAFGASEGLDPDFQTDYARHFRSVDDRLRIALQRPDEVLTHALMGISDREFEESEFHRDLVRRAGIFYALGFTVTSEGEPFSLSIHRPRGVGEFDSAEVKAMVHLGPHLRRGIRLSRLLLQARQLLRDAETALDLLPSALVLLDQRGRPTLVNQAARRILSAGQALKLDRGGLRGATAGATAQLRALVQKTARLAAGREADGGGLLRLPSTSGGLPLLVLVAPLPASSTMAAGTRASVALYLRDPEAEPRPSCARLQNLYGLTPAEARLAARLASGDTPDEAAERLGVGRETVRSQLKALFAKTDTRRQSELLRKIALDSALLPDAATGPRPRP